jgi:hypothetical protein
LATFTLTLLPKCRGNPSFRAIDRGRRLCSYFHQSSLVSAPLVPLLILSPLWCRMYDSCCYQNGQLPPRTVTKSLSKSVIFADCCFRALKDFIPVCDHRSASYYQELVLSRLLVPSATNPGAGNCSGRACGRRVGESRGNGCVARMSLLMSRKTLLAIKASVAKDAVNLLRKITIRLRKLRFSRGRVTKQSAQFRLCSRANTPLNWCSRDAMFVSNNKSRTRSLGIMS